MTDHQFEKSPLTKEEIAAGLALTGEGNRDARLLCEYWEVSERARVLKGLMAIKNRKKAKRGDGTPMELSPLPLMTEQIKGMVKYLGALAVRLHYEQGGTKNEDVMEKVRAAAAGAHIEPDGTIQEIHGKVVHGELVPIEGSKEQWSQAETADMAAPECDCCFVETREGFPQ